MLSTTEPRCQGRYVRFMGGATLCQECTDCRRRTDMPTDMQSVKWMQPPVKHWYFLPCSARVEPEGVDVAC